MKKKASYQVYIRQIETLSKIASLITSGLYLEELLRLIVQVTAEEALTTRKTIERAKDILSLDLNISSSHGHPQVHARNRRGYSSGKRYKECYNSKNESANIISPLNMRIALSTCSAGNTFLMFSPPTTAINFSFIVSTIAPLNPASRNIVQ